MTSRTTATRAAIAFATLGLCGLGLGACAAPGGAPLVSAQYPPAADSSHSVPQPLDSLPPGAANLGTAPGATHPNYLSYTFPAI